MPLVGENRTLVKAGLRQLQQTDRPGFGALLEEVGLAGKPITAENISYAIAPRINAAGRMDNAVTALQLVLCEEEERAGRPPARLPLPFRRLNRLLRRLLRLLQAPFPN